jgi:hypothetical protein
MKKIYILLAIVAASASANAQNLITNGSFESWTAGTPDSFTITVPANGGSIIQETTDFYSGASSAKFTAPIGTGTLKAALADFSVIAGHSYTLTYWYKDATDGAKSRHWGTWRTSTAAITDTSLQPDYSPNTTGWQQVTVTVTAPATATLLRFDYRVYQDVTNAGVVLVDDMSIVDNGVLAVNQNSISGLKVYPNPVVNGNLFITSNSNESKSVAIFDVLGKQVVKTTVTDQAINVANLKGGVYIVKITEEGKTATRKLVIQ